MQLKRRCANDRVPDGNVVFSAGVLIDRIFAAIVVVAIWDFVFDVEVWGTQLSVEFSHLNFGSITYP